MTVLLRTIEYNMLTNPTPKGTTLPDQQRYKAEFGRIIQIYHLRIEIFAK